MFGQGVEKNVAKQFLEMDGMISSNCFAEI